MSPSCVQSTGSGAPLGINGSRLLLLGPVPLCDDTMLASPLIITASDLSSFTGRLAGRPRPLLDGGGSSSSSASTSSGRSSSSPSFPKPGNWGSGPASRGSMSSLSISEMRNAVTRGLLRWLSGSQDDRRPCGGSNPRLADAPSVRQRIGAFEWQWESADRVWRRTTSCGSKTQLGVWRWRASVFDYLDHVWHNDRAQTLV